MIHECLEDTVDDLMHIASACVATKGTAISLSCPRRQRGRVSSRSSRQNEVEGSRSNNTFDAAVQQLYGERDSPNGGADGIDGHGWYSQVQPGSETV